MVRHNVPTQEILRALKKKNSLSDYMTLSISQRQFQWLCHSQLFGYMMLVCCELVVPEHSPLNNRNATPQRQDAIFEATVLDAT